MFYSKSMEKLFMQIFEKKNQIVEQVRHQTLLFDQQLASRCILDGIAPPPWLWSPSFPSAPSAPTELNKEELISELLLPCPSSIPYTEVRNSNKAFDAEDRSSVSPQLPNDVGGASDGIEKPDSSSASSQQDHRNVTVSDINSEPFQSLARIQRSKSRQRALELRDSAKAAKGSLYVENDMCAYSCLLNRSGTAEVYNESCEVEEAKIFDFQSKENGTTNYTGRITRTRISSLQPNSLRESSRMGDPTSVGRSSRGDRCAYPCLLNRSGISTPQSGQGHESGLVKHAEVYNESCEEEEAKICDFQSKEKGTTNYTGRIKRSRISRLQPTSLRESSCMGDPTSVGRSSRGDTCAYSCLLNRSGISTPQSGQVHKSGLVKSAEVYIESCEVEEAKICDFQSKEKGTANYTGRITRSRISSLQPNSLRESSRMGDPTSVGRSSWGDRCAYPCLLNRSGISTPQSGQVHESRLVKPAEVYNESCEVEEPKICDFQSKDKGTTNFTGRITRSRISRLQPSSLRESSCMGDPTSVGRSSRGGKNVDCSKSSRELIEEDLSCLRSFGSVGVGSCPQQVGGQITDVVSASPRLKEGDAVQSNVGRSLIDEMDHVPMTEESKPSSVRISHLLLEHADELETVKPVDTYYESGMVEDAKVDVLHSRENGSNLYSGRITRSGSSKVSPVRITSQVDEMNHVEQPMTGGSKSSPVRTSSSLQETVDELESLKPVDICYGNCVVEEAKVSGLQSREEGKNFYSGRITRSQSSSQQVSSMWESLDVENSFATGKSSSNEKNPGSSISTLQIGKKFIWSGKKLISGEDGSSPGLKRRRIESQLNDSLSASPNLRDETVAQSNVIRSPVAANDPNGGCHTIQGSQSPPNLLDDKGELSLEERDRSACTPFTLSYEESEMPLIPSLVHQATGDSKVFSNVEAGEADPTSFIYDSSGQGTERENEVLLHRDDNFEKENPDRQSMELICADQAIPEFEGFIMQTDSEQSHVAGEDISFKLNLPKNSIERASLLEQLCKSTCIHTPLSQFSSMFKFHGEPNIYQSVPNGLLECIDMESNLEVNDDVFKQFNSCYSYFNKGVNQEMYHSDCLPLSNAQSSWGINKPFMSPVGKLTAPVGKLWDRNTSNPGSSEKRGGLNPELFCISEENDYTEEVVDVVQEHLVKEMMPHSVKREPLADVTENLPASAFEAEIFAARNSLESVNTEYSFTGTCNGVTQKLGHHNSSKRGQTNKAKVSNSISIEKYGMNRMSESVQGRFSKPQVLGKPGLRKEGPSLGRREAKRNNIVSNVTSFVPLVKQKQAAAIARGKKHNPVKTLEPAELAKQLAQEKENKCNTEKEARKAEHARMEQENLKQMELRKKIKEEESKKKEADMAARKRWREEEKKDKEPKSKCGMEPWKQQQRENRENLCTKKEKELKCQSVDERPKHMKASRNGAGRDNKKETEMGGENLGKLSKTEPKTAMVSTSDSVKASIVLEAYEASTGYGDNSKAKSNLEKSYDISPYKDSDDEDEDDDDIPNSKFIPSWASKSAWLLLFLLNKD